MADKKLTAQHIKGYQTEREYLGEYTQREAVKMIIQSLLLEEKEGESIGREE